MKCDFKNISAGHVRPHYSKSVSITQIFRSRAYDTQFSTLTRSQTVHEKSERNARYFIYDHREHGYPGYFSGGLWVTRSNDTMDPTVWSSVCATWTLGASSGQHAVQQLVSSFRRRRNDGGDDGARPRYIETTGAKLTKYLYGVGPEKNGVFIFSNLYYG